MTKLIARLWKGGMDFRGRSMEEIAALNLDQIDMLTRGADDRPRTKIGRHEVIGSWPKLTFAIWRKKWRACGKTDDWIAAEWKRHYPKEPMSAAGR